MENIMKENNPKSPMELFGIECEDGWATLYRPLMIYIEEYNKHVEKEEDKIVILQIKEKFGGLRFYTNFTDDTLRELIDSAEARSYHMCERCGSETDIYHTCGYIQTLCLHCLKKIVEKEGRPIMIIKDDESQQKYWLNTKLELEEYKQDLP